MIDYTPDLATAREDLCRFLAACFYEPAPEFEEEKLFDALVTAASQVDLTLADHARRLRVAFGAQDLQTLLVDYTRLFLGPNEALAQPYGSFWLDAPVPAEDIPPSPVLAWYADGGFELGDDFGELPDHVAVELEFLYLLTYNKNQAQEAGNSEECLAIASLEKRFLDEHLALWIEPFCAAVRNGAQTAFYRELAEITEYFVTIEVARLK